MFFSISLTALRGQLAHADEIFSDWKQRIDSQAAKAYQ
jgi:hypothetical protein